MLAGLGSLMIPEIAKAAAAENKTSSNSKITLSKESVILFQGDSITDCFRDKNSSQCNTQQEFGTGYVLFTATQLMERWAALQPKIYNRGISGHKVFQLRERWDKDCINIKPDVLSILIGVNDYWHTLSHNYTGTLETYDKDLRSLLEYTKEKLPKTQLVLCEPFTLKGGSAIDPAKWYPMFDEYRAAARKIAEDFHAIFVPFQAAFDKAVQLAPDRYWSSDGVHPDLPGRQLMANLWMEVTGLK